MRSCRSVQESSQRPPERSRIALLRLERDLTRTEVARRAGLSPKTLERIETDRTADVKLRHLVNLALVLGVDLFDVLEDAWLNYRRSDLSVTPPERQILPRPAGGREPRPSRERATRRSGA